MNLVTFDPIERVSNEHLPFAYL